MKRLLTQVFVFLLLLGLIIGCGATVPQVNAWRPWTRHLHQGDRIPLGSAIKLDVSGQTVPLLGSEDKLQLEIGAKVAELIERRGYHIADSAYSHILKVSYETRRNDGLSISSSAYSMNRNVSVSLSEAGSSGLGVSIARTLGALWSTQVTGVNQRIEKTEAYTHCLSFEITIPGGELLWKGESIWDDSSIDILDELIPAVQTILSDLPFDPKITPHVNEVIYTHAPNYYKLVCLNRWFTCPALPYRITFKEPATPTFRAGEIPEGVRFVKASAAYVDLLQTAENALPMGIDKWDDPLNRNLWSKVQLGGIYEIGPDKKIAHIVIDLAGKPEGYYVTKCVIVSEDEYRVFRAKFGEWQQTLRKYYDMFK